MVDINKKRWIKLLYVVLWISLFVGLFSNIFVLKEQVQTLVWGDNNSIVEEKYSPNRKYKAVKFKRNMGATTSINYQVSIISAKDELGNDIGNICGAESDFDFEWQDDRTLIIKNYPKSSFFKMESSYKEIEVLYQ